MTCPTQLVDEHETKDPEGKPVSDDPNLKYVYEVDGVVYRYDKPEITGAEIMAAADIPRSDGLVQILDDGTTKSIGADDKVYLVQGAQFKRRPRFKRG